MAEGNSTSHAWDEGFGTEGVRSALLLPSRSEVPRTGQVTQKSISGGDVGAGTNSPPDYLPTLPLIT